ncbi:uncharacterized protein LOC125025638 [Penaeus chinensis]|uniref:uncharacterized protein LOC125025638 n=1 Tax=Penaeus chinensis TaxID=139456 RepID=UPI001FB623FF|nr:uncharacterized protein LOC125025638 [Penaeus chinensis]
MAMLYIHRNVSRGYTHNGRCSVTGNNTKINPQGNKCGRETGFCINRQIKLWTNRGTTRLEQVWLGNNGVRGTSVAEKHGWSCNQCSKLCREATFSSTQTLHKRRLSTPSLDSGGGSRAPGRID